MLKKIILEDFMSHRHSEFELAEGLTVLVGPNNSGKSAVVAALELLCQNQPANYAIRHGAREARVTVQTDDGHTIVWRRHEKGAAYEIDGRSVSRLKKSEVPRDLHEILRLPHVSINDGQKNVDIHVAAQKSPVFEVLSDSSMAAGFFASSSDAAYLLEMHKRHQSKVNSHKSERRDAQKEIARLERDEALLQPVEQYEKQLSELTQQTAQLKQDEERAGKLREHLRLQRERATTLRYHERQREALQNLRPFPQFADTGPLRRHIDTMKETQRTAERERTRYQALEPVHPPPQLHETTPLRQLCWELDTTALKALAFERRMNTVKALAEPPVLNDPAPLYDVYTRLQYCTQQVQDAEQKLVQAQQDLDASRQAIDAWVSQHPECPVCGGPLETDRLVAGGHRHDA